MKVAVDSDPSVPVEARWGVFEAQEVAPEEVDSFVSAHEKRVHAAHSSQNKFVEVDQKAVHNDLLLGHNFVVEEA